MQNTHVTGTEFYDIEPRMNSMQANTPNKMPDAEE